MKNKDTAGAETTAPEYGAPTKPANGVRLRTLVFGLSATLMLIGVVVAGASFYVSSEFKQSGKTSETMMTSMRAHMTADMLHDSMRGIVFRGLYAGVSGDVARLD